MTTQETMPPGRDDALHGFLRALPPERREELRAILSATRERSGRETGRDSGGGPDISRGPAGAGDAGAARHAADLVLLAGLRAAGRDLLATATAEEAARHIVRLSEVAPERLQWLSPGRLAAGKITVLDGDPGLGKSTLLCELAARVTRGEALPGGAAGRPRGVLLLSAEDDLRDTIRPRLDAAGGDPHRVLALMTAPDGTAAGRPVAIPDDVPLLEAVARRIDAALLIIDPLVAYLQGGLSANSDQDVRRALAALKQLGERTGAAIVAVRHLNKSTGANPLYRGGGSIGIIGAARCGLLLAPDPDDPERRILATTKGNLGKPPPSLAFRLESTPGSDAARIVWAGETHWTAAQLLRAADEAGDEPGRPSQLEEARAWLREALADRPRPVKAIEAEAAARGIPSRTLQRARSAEGAIARKERGQHGQWVLALPEPDDDKDRQPSPGSTLGGLGGLTLPERESLGIDATDAAEIRRCVDCAVPLAAWQTTRCGSCLADALTQ